MPLLNWDTTNLASASLPGRVLPPEPPPEPGMGGNPILDTAAAAFRQSNIISNLPGAFSPPPRVPGYNPMTDPQIAGFEDEAHRFVHSASPAETAGKIAQIGQEQRDRRTLGQAGGWGLAASIAAGTVDPATLASMMIPAAGPAAWGGRLLRIGAAVAANMAVDTASEVALHQLQELRTVDESLINVGAGAVLSGAFGALATRVPKSEFDLLRARLNGELRGLEPAPQGGGGSTVGAASVSDATTLSDETIAKGGRFLANTVGRISPVTRLMQSPLKSVRQLAQRLVEVPYVLNKNLRGIATPTAIETDIKRRVARSRLQVVNSLEDAFTKYGQRAAKEGGQAMSLKEFGAQVSQALRRGDVSDVAEVGEVAQAARRIFDEDRKALQELGVVPEEFTLMGAQSYFPRVYDFEAITRNRTDFETRLRDWFKKTPKLLMANDEVLSSVEGAPTQTARFFSEDFADVPDARSVVLRDNTGSEIGRSVIMERGDRWQIVRAQLAPGWKGRGYGQRMISDAALEAEKAGKQLVSDSVVSADQLKAYEGLRRKGWLVEYADKDAVEAAIKSGEDVVGPGPAVTKIMSPEKRLAGLVEQQKAAREALKAAKEAYTGVKAGSREARNDLRAAQRRVAATQEKLDELMLEKEQVALVDTRGKGQRFHGTSSEIPKLDSNYYSPQNIYGQGFYTTDSANVAKGYTKKGGGSQPTIYRVEAADDVKLFDMSQPVPDKIKASLLDPNNEYGVGGLAVDALQQKPNLTLQELYDEVRAGSAPQGYSVDSVQEFFDQLRYSLEQDGYAGLIHTGGGRVGKEPHDVRIYWHPERDVKITKASPDEFTPPKLTAQVDRLKERLVKNDERVSAANNKTMASEADQAKAWKDRRAEQVELRKINREIRSAKAGVAQAKRDAKHSKEVADRAEPMHMSDAEVQTAVMETVDRILGTARGLADVHNPPLPGPYKARSLNVPDEVLEPYLVSDFERVMSGYVRAMAPHLEMRKAFGSSTLQAQKDEIMDSSRAAINALKSNAEKEKLRKATAQAIEDLDRMRDRLLGTAGPKGDAGLGFVRAQRLVRAYNYVRLLGSQVLSSMSDYGHVMSRYGLTRTAATTAKFLTNVKANKLTRADAKRMGTALEWTLDTRSDTLAEIGDDLAGSKLEQYAGWAANKFSRATGMSTWNSVMKAMTSALEQDAVIRALRKPGGPNKNETIKLAQAGIGQEMYDRIRGQLVKYADDSDGMNRARTDMWDDKEAARVLEDAVVKAADIMVVTRGAGDLPLLMDSEVAKTLMQFKSFGMSAVNRVLIPMAQGLARGDVASANGLMAMLAMGGMTYVVKEIAAGREPDLSPERIIPEALNWSGALAYLPDVYDPLAGLVHAPRLSRYTNRTPIETLLGPTLGTATEAYQTVAGVTDLGVTQQDLHRVRAMLPLQNLFYLRRIINALEGETGEAIGAEGATPGTFINRVSETEPAEAQ